MPFIFRKFRFWYRFILAIIRKYTLALLFGALAGTASFFLVPKALNLIPSIRVTNTIAVVGRFTQAELPLSIQQKISLGLTSITPDGQAAPALAESWSIDDSGLVYTFKINSDYLWHDGSRLKSEEIDYKFRDVSISTPAPDQLVITLKEQFSPLPISLSRPIFKVKHSRSWLIFPKVELLGVGSYRIADIKKNGEVLTRIFLVPTDTNSQLPNLNYLFYSSEDQAITAFKLGIVNHVENLSKQSHVFNWPKVRSQEHINYDRYVGIFFNTSSQIFGGTQGKNVRLALSYAIDKTRWPNRALGPINPKSWVYNPDIKTFDQDIVKSKQLLSKPDTPKEITLLTTPDNLQIAESIKSDWSKVGISTTIQTTPTYPEDFSVILLTQAIPTDPDQYNLWHSTKESNFTNLDNKRIDLLLEQGRKKINPSERQELYRDFQRFLVEDVPAHFLIHPTTYSVFR